MSTAPKTKRPELPLADLPLDADLSTVIAVSNMMLSRARAWDRARGEGGAAVLIAEGNVVISASGSDAQGGAGNGSGSGTGTPLTTGTGGDGTGGNYADGGEEFTPGDDSTPGASVVLEEGSRGGYASLIGHDEFVASTPPDKYLSMAYSGSRSGTAFPSNGLCNQPPTGVFTVTLSGAAVYDATSGLLTGTGLSSVTETPTGGSPTSNTATLSGSVLATTNSCLEIVAATATTLTNTATGACCPTGVGLEQIQAGSYQETLTSQDTEENAIARLLATVGGPWSSYVPVSGFPCAVATYGQRTAFDFPYNEARLRLTFAGMPASWLFTVDIIIERVMDGVVDLASIPYYEVTTDGAGAAEVVVMVHSDTAGASYRIADVVYRR